MARSGNWFQGTVNRLLDTGDALLFHTSFDLGTVIIAPGVDNSPENGLIISILIIILNYGGTSISKITFFRPGLKCSHVTSLVLLIYIIDEYYIEIVPIFVVDL